MYYNNKLKDDNLISKRYKRKKYGYSRDELGEFKFKEKM